MLFRKDIEPRCAYCANGEALDEDRILCIKRGICSPGEHCSRFSYDPFRRVPPKPALPDFSRWTQEDFSLE